MLDRMRGDVDWAKCRATICRISKAALAAGNGALVARRMTVFRPLDNVGSRPVHSSLLQLQRLLQLRWTEIVGQCLAIVIAVKGLGLPLRLDGLLAVCLMLGAINLFSHWRLLQPWPVLSGELFAQLCVDVLGLFLLLYQSGGSGNPFASLMLVPLTITATLMPLPWVWAMAMLTALFYSALLVWHQPLPTPMVPLDGLNDFICTVTGIDRSLLNHDNGFSLHVVGMWINFLLSALVVTVFVTRLATVLRSRERELTEARENTLRHEQVLALGTLAAGAAHELGTPLSTLAVVLRELQLDPAGKPIQSELTLLRSQVDVCKGILASLVDRASRAGVSERERLDQFLTRVVAQWRLLHPERGVHWQAEAAGPAYVRTDPALEQALLNLMNNAAEADPVHREIAVAVHRENGWCRIDVLDRGAGVDEAIRQRLGEPFITSKQASGGMGIGVFLSNATVERLGGRVEIFRREEGGTCTRISLPEERAP